MSLKLECDGCGKPLSERPHRVVPLPAITGERANGRGGGRNLPDGRFDWCDACAEIGFTAVRQANRPRLGEQL